MSIVSRCKSYSNQCILSKLIIALPGRDDRKRGFLHKCTQFPYPRILT